MSNLRLLILWAIFLSPAALAQKIPGSYRSTIFEADAITKDAIIFVNADHEDITGLSKFWAPRVAEALRGAGYNTVLPGNPKAAEAEIQLIVLAETDFSSHEYQATQYASVPSGRARINCVDTGSGSSCQVDGQRELVPSGTVSRSFSLNSHYLWLTFQEVEFQPELGVLASGKTLMLVQGSAHEDDCASSALFAFLVRETTSRLDLNMPDDYQYTARLGRGLSCTR
jgi:hypothetical protein